MKKLVFGLVLTIPGVVWSLFLFSILIFWENDSDTVIGLFIMLVPGMWIGYMGIRMIRRYFADKREWEPGFVKSMSRDFSKSQVADFKEDEVLAFTNQEFKAFEEDAVLVQWEVKGGEWERFKERKCTPEAVKRSSVWASFFTGIGSGIVWLIIFSQQSTTEMLGLVTVLSAITGGVAFIFLRKAEYNKYGFANEMAVCDLTFTLNHCNFCGKKFVFRDNNRYISNVRIIEKNSFSTLFFTILDIRQTKSFSTLYEFPIPNDKIQEAEKLVAVYKM